MEGREEMSSSVDFPPVLQLQRFEYDVMADKMVKDLWSLLPARSKEDILLFLVLHNPEEAEQRFVKRLLIKASEKPSEIQTELIERARCTPYEQSGLHEESVRCIFQKPTVGVQDFARFCNFAAQRLQLCHYFFRSNSASMRLFFAQPGLETCSLRWIMSSRSLAVHPRNLCSLIFGVLPKALELSPCLLSKLQEHVHPAPMEIAEGKLPELPQEILMDIFALLETPDLVRAGSVCSSWNSAYTSICSSGQQKQPQTPCLLYTSESAGENVACLYSLAEKRAYRLTLPEPPIHRRYLIGSSHGWVITVDEHSEMHLINPITSEQIGLPSVITIEEVEPIYDSTGAICEYKYQVETTRPPVTLGLGNLRDYLHEKALVLYDHASAGGYIVVFIHNPRRQLSFARLEDEKWTRLSSCSRIADCIYKDGLLYAVTSFGEIVAFDLRGPSVTTKVIVERAYDSYGMRSFYIVQAPCGNLLQVRRPEVWIREEVDGHRHEDDNTTRLTEIYKVCTVTKRLVRINRLDDHVLFLGSNQSLCLRAAEYPQLKRNHVYLTNDGGTEAAFRCKEGCRLNIGALNFGNKIMEEIIFPRPWSDCVTPLFIVPNPRKLDLALHI